MYFSTAVPVEAKVSIEITSSLFIHPGVFVSRINYNGTLNINKFADQIESFRSHSSTVVSVHLYDSSHPFRFVAQRRWELNPGAMSGFGKNVIPRRAHKERAQPGHRVARHGLLEKKKDYKKRAKHANRRVARLKLLREKAAFRNKDEFYHAMEHGPLRARRAEEPLASRDGETRLLVGTRDAGYVSVKHGAEAGKLRTLSKGLHFLGSACGKHTVYVSDDDDVREFVVPKNDDKPELDMTGVAKESVKKRKSAYAELEARKERLRKLTSAAQDIATEKKLLGKGARRKVRDADVENGTPAVFKWRQERKR